MADNLKWLSTSDLEALQSGNLAGVSDRGLRLLQGATLATPEKKSNPSEGGGTLQFGPFDTGIRTPQGLDRVLSGIGQGMTSLARGAGQYVGANSTADVDESNRLDKPLMDTTGGLLGSILGQVAALAPAAVAAGPSVGAAAGLGALQGALQPTGSKDSTLQNVVTGGVLGAAGPLAVRGGKAVYQGGKSLLEPATLAGRERIAARTINRFADDPSRVAAAAGMVGPTRTGSQPTLAEATGDAGLASLQDTLRSLDPQIASSIEKQLASNNAARVERLRELAAPRQAAATARQEAAAPIYERALAATMDESMAPQAASLLQSPAIERAAAAARNNALDSGTPLTEAGSLAGLHQAKLSLDDAIAKAQAGTSAAEVNRLQALNDARNRLVGFIEQASQEYGDARRAYAAASQPVNQADVGEQLLRATSNTTDLPLATGETGSPRILPDAFLRMLRNGEQTVSRATGRNLGDLGDVLDPGAMNLVSKIGQEVDRTAAVGRAGAGPGSPTAKRLASQNIINQMAGPLGIPQSWAESVLATSAMRPVQFAYSAAEPAIQQVLARAAQDPAYARQILEALAKNGAGSKSLQQVSGLLSPGRLVAPTTGLLAGQGAE